MVNENKESVILVSDMEIYIPPLDLEIDLQAAADRLRGRG